MSYFECGESMSKTVHFTKELSSIDQQIKEPVGFQIRNYQKLEDCDSWRALHQLIFAAGKGRKWTVARFRQEFLDRRWWSPDRMWIAEENYRIHANRRIVGTVCLAERPNGGNLQFLVAWLMVHPFCRRRGIGGCLLRKLEAKCQAMGHEQVYLETLESWPEAMGLYTSLGYQRIAPHSGNPLL